MNRSNYNFTNLPPVLSNINRGDIVSFTNDGGVTFEGLTVLGFEAPLESDPEKFIYLDSDCWWFPVRESALKVEKRFKSEAAGKVLKLIDSEEDGADMYSVFVAQVAREEGISTEQLERELKPFI